MTNTNYLDTLYQFVIPKNPDREARDLIKQAAASVDAAETEKKLGEDQPTTAAWHFEQALWLYRDAIVKFQQARSLSTSPIHRKFIGLRIRECIRHTRTCRSLLQISN